MASSQGSEGVSSSRHIGVCHGSGNISQTSIQLVDEGGIEEDIEDTISCQEKECSIPEGDT